MIWALALGEGVGALISGLRRLRVLPQEGRRPGAYAVWGLVIVLIGIAALSFLPWGWMGMILLAVRYIFSGAWRELKRPGFSARALDDLLRAAAWRRLFMLAAACAAYRWLGATEAAVCACVALYEAVEAGNRDDVNMLERTVGCGAALCALLMTIALWMPGVSGIWGTALLAGAYFLAVAGRGAGRWLVRSLPFALATVGGMPFFPVAMMGQASGTALIFLALWLLREALYSAWLPVRAKMVRRRAARS